MSKVAFARGLFIWLLLFCGCTSDSGRNKKALAVIGFLDMVEDETLASARQGFFDALAASGFSQKQHTLKVIHVNAQGDMSALVQGADMLVSRKVNLIACNTTLATITAAQRTQTIPICMMVAPRPDIAGLTDDNGQPPANLFGVYETLEYIDTAIHIIHELIPQVKRIGTIYNQSELQSRLAFSRLAEQCRQYGWELFSLPVNNSSETQMVTESLLARKPDVFFALPDNVIFASFETVAELCNRQHVPIFTSEAGLVVRGAVASFGADFYLWGFQAGQQAATFLKNQSLADLKPEIVKVRKRVINRQAAARYSIVADTTFVAL
jgi:putative ABC transport system substrate-binding protein